MVKIGLQVKANLQGCTALRPDGDDFRWYLKLRCANCGHVPDHWQYISQQESHPLKGGRGEASCVMQCKMCCRENSINILPETVSAFDYTHSLSSQWHTLVVFDCRGLEPVQFSPRNGWATNGFKSHDEDGQGGCQDDNDHQGCETGSVFSDVDLTDSEWVDYDEKGNMSVCITELQFQFVKVK